MVVRPWRVMWIGVQDARCCPGWNGYVIGYSRKDPDSIKVLWDEREEWMPKYTWERRKNLQIESET